MERDLTTLSSDFIDRPTRFPVPEFIRVRSAVSCDHQHSAIGTRIAWGLSGTQANSLCNATQISQANNAELL